MTEVPPWNPDEVGPSYVYARLADHIAARIAAGELAPGARLPGEREMSEEYGVALGTVRRALDVLRERGVIVTLASKGTFVVAARP
jgi:GntR family transcriptional regulator